MAKISSKNAAVKTGSKEDSTKTFAATDAQWATDAGSSLQQLFVSELRDTYWAENHLVKSIPKMIAAAGTAALKKTLAEHLTATATQVSRLEKAFDLLGEKIIAKKCDAMEGLTMSGEHVIENTVSGTATRDTGIIMSALKVENFEITTYKGLIQTATKLGKTDVAGLLQQNLDEEVEASELLTALSQSDAGNQPV